MAWKIPTMTKAKLKWATTSYFKRGGEEKGQTLKNPEVTHSTYLECTKENKQINKWSSPRIPSCLSSLRRLLVSIYWAHREGKQARHLKVGGGLFCSEDGAKAAAHLDLSPRALLHCPPWTLNCAGREISKPLMNSWSHSQPSLPCTHCFGESKPNIWNLASHCHRMSQRLALVSRVT